MSQEIQISMVCGKVGTIIHDVKINVFICNKCGNVTQKSILVNEDVFTDLITKDSNLNQNTKDNLK